MRLRSLRLRLAIAAAISILVALVIAGFGLSALFERHVERRVRDELDNYLRQLSADIVFTSPDTILIEHELPEPRFDQPLSGFYWQIDLSQSKGQIRSRSLWDHALTLPHTGADKGVVHHYLIDGPASQALLASERYVIYPQGEVRLAVAIDRTEIVKARRAFDSEMIQFMSLLAGMLMMAAWGQIVIGLRPLEAVRRSVTAVRRGEQRRIAVDRPEEVMPLVNEVNSLLDAQVEAMRRARSRATDLAHGLKTPLTVLMADAERLRAKGDIDLAAEIEELVGGMRRHVDRELSRSHLLAGPRYTPQRTPVKSIIDGLARTLARSPKGAPLKWLIDVPENVNVAAAPDDFAELLGVILDNAVKWAEREIRISARAADGLALVIEDDGPGVTPQQLHRLGERGVRLDQSVEGSGLGLAIATDIAEAYSMTIAYALNEPSGFRVTIRQALEPNSN